MDNSTEQIYDMIRRVLEYFITGINNISSFVVSFTTFQDNRT